MYKKVFFLFIVIIVSFCQQETFATSSFAPFIEVKKIPNFSDSNLSVLSHLSIKQIESLTGKKLNLKERFALKIYKSKPALFNQYIDSTEEKKTGEKGIVVEVAWDRFVNWIVYSRNKFAVSAGCDYCYCVWYFHTG